MFGLIKKYPNSVLSENMFIVEAMQIRPLPQKNMYLLTRRFSFLRLCYCKKAADQFTLLKRIQRSNYFSDMLCDSAGNYQCKNAQILLSILGNLRQESFHENRSTSAWMFNLEKVLTPERKKLLTALIDSRTNHINNHFIENSNKNLNAIFRLFPEKSQADLIVEYYDFSVRKAYKNLGFSVKLLREMLLKTQQELSPLNDKAYDSIRSKLYTMFDFVLYKLYVDNEEQIDQFVRNYEQAPVMWKKRRCISRNLKEHGMKFVAKLSIM